MNDNSEEIWRSLMGVVVHSEDEAYSLYKDYALRTCFSVRKGHRKFFQGTKEVRMREYMCNKEGLKNDDSLEGKQYTKMVTRTGCEACIRFTVKDGIWKVTHFNPHHNHSLASHLETHLLKSARSISTPKQGIIDSMVNSGVKTSTTFTYLAKEAGGEEHIGCVKKDCYNFVDKQKRIMLEAGDSQSLINYFKKLQVEDPMFFYTFDADDENRLTHFFWRDGRALSDYNCFGEVIVFDTTFRTNKYGLICAPFVGVNHHWKNILFGCAFLLDQSTSSFVWLFESFLEAMGGKPPMTIITDQDHAIAKAIEIVFPKAKHHLCVWHISTNAPSHLGNTSSNKDLYDLFNNCLYTCESEEEFEESWNELKKHVSPDTIHWLNIMYNIREKWSPAFTKREFSAGMKASQRSESTNRVLNGLATATTNLTKFAMAYQDLVKGMRSTELQDDFRCKQGTPVVTIKNSGILRHAAKVYTYKLFKLFEMEFMNSLAMTWEETNTIGQILVFQIKEENCERVRTVRFNSVTNEVDCSCKLFQWLGILCRHTLRVINLKNLTAIPDQYVLNRWTKDAKQGIKEHAQGETTLKTCNEMEAVFRNSMMRLAYNLITRSQGNVITREICRNKLLECELHIENEFAKSGIEKEQAQKNTNEVLGNSNEPPIGDPVRKRSKGDRNERIKKYFEKKKKKTAAEKTKRPKKSTPIADQAKQNNLNEVQIYQSQHLTPENQVGHQMQVSSVSYGNLLMQMNYQGYAHNFQADNPTSSSMFFVQDNIFPSLPKSNS